MSPLTQALPPVRGSLKSALSRGNGEDVHQLASSSPVAVVDASSLATWASQTGPATIGALPSGAQVVLASGDFLCPADLIPRTGPSEVANRMVCLWHGDITALRIDGIVNAANTDLLPGGGISGAIHSAAGPALALECSHIGRCREGETVITSGCKLPAKFVLHTVGPVDRDPLKLRSCYESALNVAAQNGLRSVAFCCVSAGIFGFPLLPATHVALGAVRSWLDAHPYMMDRVVFVTYRQREHDVYAQLMPSYFPRAEDARLPQGPAANTGSFGGEVPEEMDTEVDLFGVQPVPRWQGQGPPRPSGSATHLAAERDLMAVHERTQGEATPTCARPGCKWPSWNGKWGEFCSKTCRGSTL